MAEVDLSPIKAVELRASRIPGVVSLAQGIPSFDTPEPIKQFVAEKLAAGACAKYSVTPGLPELRELIAETLLHEGMRYDPDTEIIITCGAIEAIAATLLTSINPGDEVLVTSPTYASYIPAIRLAGGVPRFVALNEDANFDLDPDAIAAAVTRRTAAILLCNPNNPTGTIFSRAQTLRMLDVAERHNLLVVTDEVYKDFVYSDTLPFSPAAESSARPRVVRVVSFSKSYGMTGWRVGFLHAARERVSEILKVHDTLVTCAPVVSQYAAIAALTLAAPYVAEFRAQFHRRRDRVIGYLDELADVFDYQRPNASYFVFPRVKDTVPLARDSRRLAADILDRAHVALVPGVAFGPTGEAHLRLCYARDDRDIDVAFERLAEYFQGPRRLPAAGPRIAAAPLPAAGRRRPLWRRVGVGVVRLLARLYLTRRRPRVVALAGSRGKTVIKRLLVEALSGERHVRANPLSYNTEVGLPLAILDTTMDTRSLPSLTRGFGRAVWTAICSRKPIDVLVVEFGVRHADEMAAHLRVVRPDIAVIASVSPSFSEDHQALALLRAEIAVLCDDVTRRAGTLLLCGDDPSLAALAAELPKAYHFDRGQLVVHGGRSALHLDGTDWPVQREIVGDSNLYGLIVAARVGQLLGISEAARRRFLGGV
ncbi:MAG: aminotransferase class I/II-fold pyridoxal phosphate-dependent enzyme [Deltaproteobacteria bacterium]|nr:aminotransferase class I/II-fold pyridoxal phosphate-dependent enzyme [Deltaproteobacteria bacterium]MBI3387527.1 aminotransferase class I/II-fold pyridoxal phosphate-dependent enzyme [Deltaproteobacteria bacterium]